jgi:hypothetical protein
MISNCEYARNVSIKPLQRAAALRDGLPHVRDFFRRNEDSGSAASSSP